MAICSFQTMSPCLTALSDNCIGIMVGDGARFGVACDPLSIPIRAMTLLNASLIFQSFRMLTLRASRKNAHRLWPQSGLFPLPLPLPLPRTCPCSFHLNCSPMPPEKSKAGLLPPHLLTERHTARHYTLYLLALPAPSGRSCPGPSH